MDLTSCLGQAILLDVIPALARATRSSAPSSLALASSCRFRPEERAPTPSLPSSGDQCPKMAEGGVGWMVEEEEERAHHTTNKGGCLDNMGDGEAGWIGLEGAKKRVKHSVIMGCNNLYI